MSYQSSCRPTRRRAGPPARCLALERQPADEVALVEADQPAEPDLERASSSARGSSRGGPRCSRPRAGSARPRAGRRPGRACRPAGSRRPRRPPSARPRPPPRARPGSTARSRGRRCSRSVTRRPRRPADLRGPSPEVAQVGERLAGRRLEDVPRQRALEGERGGRFGLLVDRDVEPGAVLAQPAELRVGRGPAVAPLVEAMDRPVVDDLAVLVAPRACSRRRRRRASSRRG